MLVRTPHVVLLARIAVSLILLIAALGKLSDLTRFVQVIRDYGILPRWANALAGYVLPTVEILIATGMLIGYWPTGMAVAASCLFFLFGIAIAINLLRGRHGIGCGCFGKHAEYRLSWWLVARNIALIAIAGLTSAHPAPSLTLVGALSLDVTLLTALVAGSALAICWVGLTIVGLWRSIQASATASKSASASSGR